MKIISALGFKTYLRNGHYQVLQLDEPSYVTNVVAIVIFSILVEFSFKHRTWTCSIDFCNLGLCFK
jgi:hypothetical protein